MLSTIGELNLRDEYALLPHNAVLADIAKALSPVKNMAVLIKERKSRRVLLVLSKHNIYLQRYVKAMIQQDILLQTS